MYYNMVVPKGKKLILNRNGSPYIDQDMILEEDITINISSQFQPIFGGGDTKLVDVVGGISRSVFGQSAGFSGQFKQLGLQVWAKTEPVSLPSLTIGFYIDKKNPNGYTQVFLPMKKLRKLPVPDERDSGNLIPPGPTLVDAFKGLQTSKTPVFSIRIGTILYLPQVVIKKAEPTYSNETDTYGYPIWGKIALDVISIFTATTKLLDYEK